MLPASGQEHTDNARLTRSMFRQSLFVSALHAHTQYQVTTFLLSLLHIGTLIDEAVLPERTCEPHAVIPPP